MENNNQRPRRPIDDNPLAAAFLDGAQYWEFSNTGGTMWPSDQNRVADEAVKRYRQPAPEKRNEPTKTLGDLICTSCGHRHLDETCGVRVCELIRTGGIMEGCPTQEQIRACFCNPRIAELVQKKGRNDVA